MNLHGLYSYNVIDSIASIRLKHKLFRHLWALFVHENQTIIIFATPLSFTLVHYVETDKRIFKKFSPSGSHTILVFLYQKSWQYSDGNHANGGVECRWGRQKWWFPTSIWLHCMLSMLWLARCYQHGAAGPWQVVTLIAGSKWRSLLMARDDDEMFMTRSLNVMPKTTEQRLIIHSAKISIAYVINNKRKCSSFCTIEANHWQTRSIAWPLCNSRATCHISANWGIAINTVWLSFHG